MRGNGGRGRVEKWPKFKENGRWILQILYRNNMFSGVTLGSDAVLCVLISWFRALRSQSNIAPIPVFSAGLCDMLVYERMPISVDWYEPEKERI